MSPEQELEQLIAEQAKDMRLGHIVSRPNTRSLDFYGDNRRIPKAKKFRAPLSSQDSRHGTPRGYQAGCTCKKCRAAESNRVKARRRRLKQETPFDKIPHGLNGYSNYMCRCEICTKANRDTHREYMREKGRAA